MKRVVVYVLAFLMVAAMAAPSVAGEGRGRRGEGMGRRGEWLRERRAGGDADNPFAEGGERPEAAGRRRPGSPKHPILKALFHRFLMTKPEAKAEMKRFQAAMKEHHAAGRKIHEAIRADIKNGKTPEEAFEAHEAELVAHAKQGILLGVRHHEAMARIAEQYADEAAKRFVSKLKERILHGPRRRPDRPEGGEGEREGEGRGRRRRPMPLRRGRRGGERDVPEMAPEE
jgi:Ni/Co efflux regulator RcnB